MSVAGSTIFFFFAFFITAKQSIKLSYVSSKKFKFAGNQTIVVMKGVSYVTDEQNKRVAVQIELKVLEKYDEQIEDLIDGIIAESRRDEPCVSLSKVIRGLKQSGKLK